MDAVSSVVVRGCDGPHCSARTVHFLDERRENFEKLIYTVFKLHDRPGDMPPRSVPIPYDFDYVMRWMHAQRSRIEGNILVSQNKAIGGVPYYSQEYQFEPLVKALRTAAYFGFGEFGEEMEFFLSDEEQGLRGFYAGTRTTWLLPFCHSCSTENKTHFTHILKFFSICWLLTRYHLFFMDIDHAF